TNTSTKSAKTYNCKISLHPSSSINEHTFFQFIICAFIYSAENLKNTSASYFSSILFFFNSKHTVNPFEQHSHSATASLEMAYPTFYIKQIVSGYIPYI